MVYDYYDYSYALAIVVAVCYGTSRRTIEFVDSMKIGANHGDVDVFQR